MTQPGPRLEISPRQWSVRIYGEHPTDYEASCQIFRYGDRAFFYGVIGARFYAAAAQVLEWARGQGLRTLEGYMGSPHARLLERVTRGTEWRVVEQGTGRFDGHELVWICLQDTGQEGG